MKTAQAPPGCRVFQRPVVWWIASAFLLLVAQARCALAGDFSVNGFGTAGVAYLDKQDGWTYVRAINQKLNASAFRADLDSVLGLQVNYRPNSTLELVGQLSVSALDAEAQMSDYIELAFLAWRPDPNWAVRLGRVNLDAYLYSDHRDVGFTYPYVRPPVEFYSRLPTSVNGGDISRTWVHGDTQWLTKVFVGSSSTSAGAGTLRFDPIYGLMVSRETNGLLLRASGAYVRLPENAKGTQPLLLALQQIQALPVPQVASQAADLARPITTAGTYITYFAVGASYDRNRWLVTAEVSKGVSKGSPITSQTNGYLSVGRRFGAVTAYAMQSVTKRDAGGLAAPDWATPLAPLGPQVALQAQAVANAATTALNDFLGDQESSSLGVRWDATPWLAIKAQVDRVHTASMGVGTWRNATSGPDTSHVFAITADFLF